MLKLHRFGSSFILLFSPEHFRPGDETASEIKQ
jgi:hypothetical protein